MKRFLIILALLLNGSVVSAKQFAVQFKPLNHSYYGWSEKMKCCRFYRYQDDIRYCTYIDYAPCEVDRTILGSLKLKKGLLEYIHEKDISEVV